eukprot:1079676-Karenia_brevis.AAC.1
MDEFCFEAWLADIELSEIDGDINEPPNPWDDIFINAHNVNTGFINEDPVFEHYHVVSSCVDAGYTSWLNLANEERDHPSLLIDRFVTPEPVEIALACDMFPYLLDPLIANMQFAEPTDVLVARFFHN